MSETAWLIEYGNGSYWDGRGEETGMRDVNDAVRFARREDAERVCHWIVKQRGGARVTEHMWLDATEPTADDDYDGDIEPDCLICAGEGFLSGADMGDPLWYDDHKSYRCYSCGGTGLRKDMTVW